MIELAARVATVVIWVAKDRSFSSPIVALPIVSFRYCCYLIITPKIFRARQRGPNQRIFRSRQVALRVPQKRVRGAAQDASRH